MILRDSVHIQATPERVFDFFDKMERHYVQWHPDHHLFRWVKGQGVAVGNEFYFEETLNGEYQKKQVRFTQVEPNRRLEFVPSSWFLRLFMPRLWFAMAPEGTGCRFEAGLQVRMGPLAEKLNEQDIAGVRQHMKEEGENLKRLLEGAAIPLQEKS